ncbi:MAG: hypothetical protein B7Z55_07210 [Planctomycetales bacterium 12-60-4]|nr:MAG: hypothetical protein B7Z55_07210 [Planctomycetales bacterium 12-60-4]
MAILPKISGLMVRFKGVCGSVAVGFADVEDAALIEPGEDRSMQQRVARNLLDGKAVGNRRILAARAVDDPEHHY